MDPKYSVQKLYEALIHDFYIKLPIRGQFIWFTTIPLFKPKIQPPLKIVLFFLKKDLIAFFKRHVIIMNYHLIAIWIL